jgi:hypothetical protein
MLLLSNGAALSDKIGACAGLIKRVDLLCSGYNVT